MTGEPAVTNAEEILALLQAFRDDLSECRAELRALNAALGRIIRATADADAKLARMESDMSRIRQHVDLLPDHVIAAGRR